jgi:hypothetical protein
MKSVSREFTEVSLKFVLSSADIQNSPNTDGVLWYESRPGFLPVWVATLESTQAGHKK